MEVLGDVLAEMWGLCVSGVVGWWWSVGMETCCMDRALYLHSPILLISFFDCTQRSDKPSIGTIHIQLAAANGFSIRVFSVLIKYLCRWVKSWLCPQGRWWAPGNWCGCHWVESTAKFSDLCTNLKLVVCWLLKNKYVRLTPGSRLDNLSTVSEVEMGGLQWLQHWLSYWKIPGQK